MRFLARKVNAFTETLNGGNPAGVVLNPPLLTPRQMKLVSKILDVSETGFVFPSDHADYKTRFFSPEVEVELCGHATIALFFSLGELMKMQKKRKIRLTQETKAGVLPVDIFFDNQCQHVDHVMMTQKPPTFQPVAYRIVELADALNINEDFIQRDLPKKRVSTGLFTLPVCITSLDEVRKLRPDFEKIKNLCIRLHVGSIHVFSFETLEESSLYHARNFAPLYGVHEDPVTGTANGAVCSYLYMHGIVKKPQMICEQGDNIGRPGRVYVEINKETVMVGGKARFVMEKELDV